MNDLAEAHGVARKNLGAVALLRELQQAGLLQDVETAELLRTMNAMNRASMSILRKRRLPSKLVTVFLPS